jgi:DNA polymerase-4
VADVLPWQLPALKARLGDHGGEWLYRRVRGLDDRAVTPREPRKQMSRERTFSKDLADDRALRRKLDGVARLAATDLRKEGLTAKTITVKLRDADFQTRSATRTLPAAVESDRIIVDVARGLFDNLRRARRRPARLIGVALSGFANEDGAEQLTLFEPVKSDAAESARDRQLSKAVDVVRQRFGDRSIWVGEEPR